MAQETHQLTMKDIAEALGMSTATVSRALKDNPHISRETCQKVQQYAREHNFAPNTLAESLRTTRIRPTKVIGVVVPKFNHDYFSSILSGINQEAFRHDYSLMVAESGEEYAEEVKICEKFTHNKVCGIIISQAKDTDHFDHFKHLKEIGIPMVFYDRICTAVDTSRVVVDDYQGAYKAVEHLINCGCRHIAFFGSPGNLEISKNRFNGYRDALLKNKLPVHTEFIRQVCDNRNDAELATKEILEQEVIPDAFFAVNDESAIGIITVAKKMGYRVPEDISVCGFGNSFISTVCDPTLTTIEQRGVEVGREAADIIIFKAEGRMPIDKIEKRVVKTRLIVRESTR